MKKIIKIGRYYYERIPQDENGEPKTLLEWDDKEIFTLLDYDGEPVEFFKRVKCVKHKEGESK